MSSDGKVFFASLDGTRKGRSSHFFRTDASAAAKVADQNMRAEAMQLKCRYQVTECDATGIESKEIRD